jgi:hypothetical protein
MQHFYIYYRIAPQWEAEASAAVKQIQFEVEAETGIQGRLLQKREEPAQWMEIYEHVAAAEQFETVLGAAVAKVGFGRFLEAGAKRTTECFQG